MSRQNNVSSNPLALLRKRAGMTQKTLAESIGKTQQYIQRIESDKQPMGGVSLRIAIQIADALSVTDLRDLLGRGAAG